MHTLRISKYHVTDLSLKMDVTWQYEHMFVFEFILLGYLLSFVFHMSLAQFSVQKVTPQSDGSSSKVKVKVRVNVHGIFSVSSASLVEVHKFEENEEPMETDQNAKEEEVMRTILCHFWAFIMVQR